MSVVAITATAATVLAAGQLVPQVMKLRRIAVPTGISPSWITLGVVTNLGWTVYRTAQGLWLGVPSPVIAAALYVVTLSLLRRSQPDVRLAGAASAAGAAVLTTALLVGDWAMLGVVLGLSGVVQAAPSLWTAWRTSRPSGISPGSWTIGLGQALLWGHYGLLRTDPALILYGSATAAMALLILLRFGVVRRNATTQEDRHPLSLTIAA